MYCLLLTLSVLSVRSELLCQAAVGNLDITLTPESPVLCLGPVSPGKYNVEYDLNASSHITLSLRDRDGYYIYSIIVGARELHIVETVSLDISAYFWISKYNRIDNIQVTGRIDTHPMDDVAMNQESPTKSVSMTVAVTVTVVWIVVAIVATYIAYRLGYRRGTRIPIQEESVPLEPM